MPNAYLIRDFRVSFCVLCSVLVQTLPSNFGADEAKMITPPIIEFESEWVSLGLKLTDWISFVFPFQEYLCESFYILLEYARTSMFLWMFVEGLYLHNMITVAVFQERLSTL